VHVRTKITMWDFRWKIYRILGHNIGPRASS